MTGCGPLCLSMSASGGGHSPVARRLLRVQQHPGQWSDTHEAVKQLRQWQLCFSSTLAVWTESCKLAALAMNLLHMNVEEGGSIHN